MNATTAGVLITVVFALVAIVAFLLFRQRAKIKIKGPGHTGLEVDASNTPTPAIRAQDLKSRKGGLVVEEGTGRGADIQQVAVDKDIRITTNSQPPKA